MGVVSEAVPTTLATKLRSARSAAAPIEKKGTADEGYDFVRASDIGEEARRLLKGRGLIVIPSVESIDQKMGKSGVLVHAHLTFEIVYVNTGESITKKWVGSGFDYPGDKALYKAITGGTKYFLAGLLGIPFGVDPEEGTQPVAPGSEASALAQRAPEVVDGLQAARRRREQDEAGEPEVAHA